MTPGNAKFFAAVELLERGRVQDALDLLRELAGVLRRSDYDENAVIAEIVKKLPETRRA